MLSQVAQTLERQPGVPVAKMSPTVQTTSSNVLNWRGFDEVLSRIWHGTHAIRQIIDGTRNS